jgi:hypothetical protein
MLVYRSLSKVPSFLVPAMLLIIKPFPNALIDLCEIRVLVTSCRVYMCGAHFFVEEVVVFLVDLSSAFLVEVVLALAVVVTLTVGVVVTDVVELGVPFDAAEGVELEAVALDPASLTLDGARLTLALADVARVVPETTPEEVAELEPPDEAVFQYSSRRDSTPLTLR